MVKNQQMTSWKAIFLDPKQYKKPCFSDDFILPGRLLGSSDVGDTQRSRTRRDMRATSCLLTLEAAWAAWITGALDLEGGCGSGRWVAYPKCEALRLDCAQSSRYLKVSMSFWWLEYLESGLKLPGWGPGTRKAWENTEGPGFVCLYQFTSISSWYLWMINYIVQLHLSIFVSGGKECRIRSTSMPKKHSTFWLEDVAFKPSMRTHLYTTLRCSMSVCHTCSKV